MLIIIFKYSQLINPQSIISVNIIQLEQTQKMLSSIIKSPLFFPLYLGFVVLVLAIVIFLIDKDTPNTVFVILLGMHISLLIYSWRQYKSKPETIKIASLSDFKSNNKRPARLASFQAEAQTILRQINMQNNPKENQNQYYLSYTNSSRQPSLSQISSPINEYTEDANIFGNNNIQTWREQFRLALEQFKKNLSSQIQNKNVYQNILSRLNLNMDKIGQAEDIVQSFLSDRSTQYCTYTIKIVNEINKLLSRNFGISLTKVPSTNTKQISMQQFYRLLDYYLNNRALPSNYKAKVITPSQSFGVSQFDLSIGRQSINQLQTDMIQLTRYSKVLQPMLLFPLQKFNSSLLIYILQSEFPNQKIQVNTQVARTNQNSSDSSNIFNSIFVNSHKNYVHIFTVQIDYWMSLMSMPQFRTKNCKKICLIFLLILIKKQSNLGHPILRNLRRLLK